MNIRDIKDVGLNQGSFKESKKGKGIDLLGPILKRFFDYFKINWIDECCNTSSALLPVGFDPAGQITQYFDPVTNLYVDIPGGGSGGATPDLQQVTDEGFTTTNDIYVVDENGNELIELTAKNGDGRIIVSSPIDQSFFQIDPIGLVMNSGNSGAQVSLAFQNVVGFRGFELPNTSLSLTTATLVTTVNGIAADTTGNVLVANNSYSTTETLTGGTWIDGKPIYRKVFTKLVTGIAEV